MNEHAMKAREGVEYAPGTKAQTMDK